MPEPRSGFLSAFADGKLRWVGFGRIGLGLVGLSSLNWAVAPPHVSLSGHIRAADLSVVV